LLAKDTLFFRKVPWSAEESYCGALERLL
jgi:hypothetical protein